MTTATQAIEQLVLLHVQKGLKAQRQIGITMLVLGVCVAPLGFAIAGSAGSGPGTVGRRAVVALLLLALFALLGLGFLLASRRDPQKNAALNVIRSNPREIVWGYIHTNTQYGRPVASWMQLGLGSGKMVSMSAEIGQEQRLLMMLSQALPWATIGFTPAFSTAFKKDPGALRRAG